MSTLPAAKRGPDHAIGRSRGGVSTNAIVDQDDLPLRLLISSGQASDKAYVADLLTGLELAVLVADCGYDSQIIVDVVQARGAKAYIPTVRDRTTAGATSSSASSASSSSSDVSPRFDKFARDYLAALARTAFRIWLRAVKSTL